MPTMPTVAPSIERRSTAVDSVERRYTSVTTFLRACRHYRTVHRRILAYIKDASGFGLVLEQPQRRAT